MTPPCPWLLTMMGRFGVPGVLLCVLSLRLKVNVCVYVLLVYFAYILVGVYYFNLAIAICLCIWSHCQVLLSLFPSNFFPFGIWCSAYVACLFGCVLRHFPIYPLTNHSLSVTWLELTWTLVIG